MSTENKRLSEKYYEAWNTWNLNIPDEIFDANFMINDPASPIQLTMGPEGVKERINVYRRGFPDLFITIEDMMAADDKVITRWILQGTHTGPFKELTPTQRQIAVTGITIHRIANGKILEGWVNWDTTSMWQQLGVISLPSL